MVPSNQILIWAPLLVGVAATFCTVVIHALILITIVHLVRRQWRLGHAGVHFWSDVIFVAGTTLMALAAHLIEIAAWAGVFILCNEFTRFSAALYYSAVSYTSLGDSDVITSASWKLLGPLETADGMLMFGVSTAMLFAVIQRLVQTRFHDSNS